MLDQFRTVNPLDCSDVPADNTSGINTIFPNNSDAIDVYCDMKTDGGGWTICRCIIMQEILNSDGHQLHQYQQNEQSPTTIQNSQYREIDNIGYSKRKKKSKSADNVNKTLQIT